jgi:phage/conjugal plasmid C-4 type zinc finger TraR family protein
MPDFADEAQLQQERNLAAAIAAARPPHQDPQVVEDGVVVCMECDVPIPLARLTAIPDACRCARCQGEYEEGHGH